MERFSLKNKTAVVTGGSGLIGSAIVEAFLEAGARVINIDTKPGAQSAALHEKRDLSRSSSAHKTVEEIFEKYSAVHVWVNNAYPRTEKWGKGPLSAEDWRENVDQQLNTYCLLSEACAETMRAKKIRGNIINIGSIYGVVGNDPGLYAGTNLQAVGAYAAIKGGVVQFSRFLAAQMGPHGIRINALCPGGIEDQQEAKFLENYAKKAPLGRMGKPEEIGSAALFLASDAASYVTGSTLMVDGGWTAI